MERADIDALPEVGLEDDEILDLNPIVAYFNFVRPTESRTAQEHY
jgi:uncharacterized protein YciW